MGWQRCGDGLRLVGIHFDADRVEAAIVRLSGGKNRPGGMFRLLRLSIQTRCFRKSTIRRFSKWCNWNDQSEDNARDASKLLTPNVMYGFNRN